MDRPVRSFESEKSFHTERALDTPKLERLAGDAQVITQAYKTAGYGQPDRIVKYLVIQFTAEKGNSKHNYPAIQTQQHGLSISEAASLGARLVAAAENARVYNRDQPDART